MLVQYSLYSEMGMLALHVCTVVKIYPWIQKYAQKNKRQSTLQHRFCILFTLNEGNEREKSRGRQ